MGVHTLVTGLNGAGKTLFTVADKLGPLSKATINYQGRDIPRRLVVGGVPQLLIPHELVEVPELDPETFEDEWSTVIRERGDAPIRFVRSEKVEVAKGRLETRYFGCDESEPGAQRLLWTALNWWAWCEPGDVIVFDECQRLFRPMASGRKVPKFISRLETARHYGVEFIYITQHAGLLHTNVRALVGPHEDVRRVFGSSRVLVYQWDKCNTAGTISKATSRFWKHDKKAFGLYKSSELHTKFGQRLPLAVWGLVGGVVILAAMGWTLRHRLQERFNPPTATTGQGTTSAPNGGATAARGGQVEKASGPVFPVYQPMPVDVARDPLYGRALVLEGSYAIGKTTYAVFGLLVDGRRVATMALRQLVAMGYSYVELGPCAGLLKRNGQERPITCGPAAAVDLTPRPAAAASQPQA